MATLPQIFNENSPFLKNNSPNFAPFGVRGAGRHKAVYWNDPVQKCRQVMRNLTEYVWGVSPASLQYKNEKKKGLNWAHISL
jgi:hypothetical protein